MTESIEQPQFDKVSVEAQVEKEVSLHESAKPKDISMEEAEIRGDASPTVSDYNSMAA